MSARLPTASSLARADACPGSFALPQVDRTSEDSSRGTAIHAYLATGDLAAVPEELRGVCGAIDLDALPAGDCEIAFCWDPATGKAARLGALTDHRAYPRTPGLIYGTADKARPGYVGDYKTGYCYVGAPPAENLQLGFLALAGSPDGCRVELLHVADDGAIRAEGADLDAIDLAGVADRVRGIVARVTATQESYAATGRVDVREGAHCRYCPAQWTCPSKTYLLAALAQNPAEALAALRGGLELTPEMAGIAVGKLKAAEDLIKQARDDLRTLAAQTPIPLPDGRIYGPVPRRSLKSAVALRVVEECLGAEVARSAGHWSASGESCEEAVRAVTPKGMKPAQHWKQIKAAIEEAGGYEEREEIRAHKA